MEERNKIDYFAAVNGATLYYERQGIGAAVLFIAGSTGDAGNFTRTAELLADEFTVVTYDRRPRSAANIGMLSLMRSSGFGCQLAKPGLSILRMVSALPSIRLRMSGGIAAKTASHTVRL
jgi:hypothetical protein